MNPDLARAYKIIFSKEPEGLKSWQVAESVIENFSGPKLGEELAEKVIYAVVLDILYPNQEMTQRIVARAEGFAKELWDELPDEVHMADLERRRYMDKNQGKLDREEVGGFPR